MEPFEKEIRRRGFRIIAGVDEAGRGPLAGPVVAGAVALPEKGQWEGIDDSKKLAAPQRERAFALIMKKALGVGVGVVDVEEIDRLNILQASLKAMRLAAGHVRRIGDNLAAVLKETHSLMAHCQACDEETACYACLKTYDNQFCHHLLKRGPVARFLNESGIACL